MRGPVKSDANHAIIAVRQFDPIGLFELHDIRSRIPENHSGFVDAMPQNVVDVFQVVLLELLKIGRGGVGDAAAIQHPSLLPVIDFNNVALGQVLLPFFVGRYRVINEFAETAHVAGMIELTDVAGAGDVAIINVGATTESIDRLLQDLFG